MSTTTAPNLQATPEKLTYGSDRHPVDSRDAYALIRARERCMESMQFQMNLMTAPEVRDMDAFLDRLDDVQNQQPPINDPLYFTFQLLLGIVDLEGYRYYELKKLDEPIPPGWVVESRNRCTRGVNGGNVSQAAATGLQFPSPKARLTPKPRAPKWVRIIPTEESEEDTVEYQLQAVIGVSSTPIVVSFREYRKLIRTLAKMRGHLQAIPEKGVDND